MIKALARAHRWKKLLESGVYATVDDLAKAEEINSFVASTITSKPDDWTQIWPIAAL